MSNETPLQDLRTYLELPLLRDHWYVAGLREEFSRDLVAKTLLDRSIVFYRKTDGELAALQNRCLHRSFPLSESVLVGDDIRCGYHGIRFSADGAVVEVPCQTRCPNVRLRSYPVRESGPFAWIWMGAPDAADVSDIPDIGGLAEPDWISFTGARKLEGSYLLMHENLADLSHFAALHGGSLGVPEDWSFPSIDVEVERRGHTVESWRTTTEWEIVRALFPSVDLSNRKVTASVGSSFLSPAMVSGWNRAVVGDPATGERPRYDVEFNHYLTPETHRSAHYYYSVARNFGPTEEAFVEIGQKMIGRIFDEDVVATRAIQHLLDVDEPCFRDINIASDKSAMAVRRALVDLSKREESNQVSP